MARLQSANNLLATEVANTIRSLDVTGEDAAAVKLARLYATEIDQAEDKAAALDKLGPKLLAVLESLGATPTARAKLKGGAPSAGPSRLAQLRASRGA